MNLLITGANGQLARELVETPEKGSCTLGPPLLFFADHMMLRCIVGIA